MFSKDPGERKPVFGHHRFLFVKTLHLHEQSNVEIQRYPDADIDTDTDIFHVCEPRPQLPQNCCLNGHHPLCIATKKLFRDYNFRCAFNLLLLLHSELRVWGKNHIWIMQNRKLKGQYIFAIQFLRIALIKHSSFIWEGDRGRESGV